MKLSKFTWHFNPKSHHNRHSTYLQVITIELFKLPVLIAINVNNNEIVYGNGKLVLRLKILAKL